MMRAKNIFFSETAPLFAALLLAAAALLGGCNKPKIIPDNRLERIFHDIYLTNAYRTEYSLNLDSLNVYEPVFANHGYTSEDMQYTIGNFAKRKSARLSDVVDAAIERLGVESRFYINRIRVQDSVQLAAHRLSSRVVWEDSLIRVSRVRDTSRLRIVLPAEPGNYDISYTAHVDSVDLNENLRATHYLVDSLGRRSAVNTRRFRTGIYENMVVILRSDSAQRKLVLDLNGYGEKMTRPSMQIENLLVRHYLPDAAAIDFLTAEMLRLPGIDSIMEPLNTLPPRLRPRPEDFLPIADSLRVSDAAADSGPRNLVER